MTSPIISNVVRLAFVGAIMSTAACNGTLHTKWVSDADTYDLWESRIDTLPFHLHQSGQADQVLTLDGRAANAGTSVDSTKRRVELYVGGTQMPSSATICQAIPEPGKQVTQTKDGTPVLAALCDGSRLVETAADTFPNATVQSPGKLLKTLRQRILYGISISRAQVPQPPQS